MPSCPHWWKLSIYCITYNSFHADDLLPHTSYIYLDGEGCEHIDEAAPDDVVNTLQDGNYTTCLVPLPPNRRRFQALMAYLPSNYRHTFIATVTGGNVVCSIWGGLQLQSVASLKYSEQDSKFVYPKRTCVRIPAQLTTANMSTCSYKCYCPEACSLVLLEMYRTSYTSDLDPTSLCEVTIHAIH